MDDLTDDDEQLMRDYEQFYECVIQCYTYLLAGEKKQARDLISYTAGVAMGLANRIRTLPISNEIKKPWEEIGISRSTWFRDQRRSRINDRERARGSVKLVQHKHSELDND